VNLRPAYLLAAAGAVVVAALVPLRPWRSLRHVVAPTLVLAGALVVSVPQIAINHHQRSSWSPTVTGASEIGRGQLGWGLVLQKYETYVGPRSEYPRHRVFYFDPVANDVREEERISEIASYREYLRVVFRHPAEMATSYALHTFNGIDVRHATPYIRDLRGGHVVVSMLLYTLLFAALARLVLPSARRRLGEISWIAVGLLIVPTLTAIPGAVEPRFFLPLHLLVLILVCFGPDTVASFFGGSTVRRLGLAATYVPFVILCVTLSAATDAQIEYSIDDTAGATRSLASEDLQWAGARNDDEAFAVQGRPNVGHGGLNAELSREDPPDLIAVDVHDPIHSLGTLG